MKREQLRFAPVGSLTVCFTWLSAAYTALRSGVAKHRTMGSWEVMQEIWSHRVVATCVVLLYDTVLSRCCLVVVSVSAVFVSVLSRLCAPPHPHKLPITQRVAL